MTMKYESNRKELEREMTDLARERERMREEREKEGVILEREKERMREREVERERKREEREREVERERTCILEREDQVRMSCSRVHFVRLSFAVHRHYQRRDPFILPYHSRPLSRGQGTPSGRTGKHSWEILHP